MIIGGKDLLMVSASTKEVIFLHTIMINGLLSILKKPKRNSIYQEIHETIQV